MIGQLVGNYKILSALGEGGMGTVFKAVDVMLEREVAIKMLRPEIASQPQIVERFRTEAVTLAKLNHPAIATLYSFFRQGDQYFMVMEYVSGQTLDNLIRQSGPLPVDRAIAILSQALEGLAHAHEMGILHRDLKPANIMLPNTGGVKVMDFGIARLLSAARMTRTGGLVGTLEYIAPERVRGQEADLRSDFYSMGVVLYEMLTGRAPFRSDTEYELMRAHLEQAPPTLASLGVSVPPAVETVLMRALAKNPDDRFSSATEFRTALMGESTATREMLKPTRLSAPQIKETRMVQEVSATTPAPSPVAAAPIATIAAPVAAAKRKPDWKLYGALTAAVVVLGLGGAFWALRKPAVHPAPAPVSPVVSNPAPSTLSNPPTGGSQGLPGTSPVAAPSSGGGSLSTASTAKSAADLVNTQALVPDDTPVPAGPPLSLSAVLRLLNSQTPSSQVIRIVKRRGVDFLINSSSSGAIQNAGGSSALIEAISKRYVGGSTPPPAPGPKTQVVQTPVPTPAQPPQPVPEVPPLPPLAPERAVITRLVQVRTLCIAPMANDLNVYITNEIPRQLGSRIQIVPNPSQADAVMKGAATQFGGVASAPGRVIGAQSDAGASVVVTDRTGARVLWHDEVTSRSVLMGVVRKGGPRKLAEHVVEDLKRALQ